MGRNEGVRTCRGPSTSPSVEAPRRGLLSRLPGDIVVEESEKTVRLVAMEGAERNIEDRLGELTARYHQQRQTNITSELLEAVAGFEALESDEESMQGV